MIFTSELRTTLNETKAPKSSETGKRTGKATHEAAERTEDATTGEAAREALYERAAFAVFVEAASDGFDEYAAAMAAASGHNGDGDWGGGD